MYYALKTGYGFTYVYMNVFERIANLKLAQDANLYTKSKKSSCIPSMNNKCCPLTLHVVCLFGLALEL